MCPKEQVEGIYVKVQLEQCSSVHEPKFKLDVAQGKTKPVQLLKQQKFALF